MHSDSQEYNKRQDEVNREICDLLANCIEATLSEAESRFWHGHPVWFLEGNPIVGYGKLKGCVRLLFWSGQSFQSSGLRKTGSFMASEARFISVNQIDHDLLKVWLNESRGTQWDYKNIVKRKGNLVRLS